MALILGDKGTGKTTLAKKFTKYTMDRGGFNDCIQLDFWSETSFQEFEHEFCNRLRLQHTERVGS